MHLNFSRILLMAFVLNAPLAGSQITIRIYDYAGIEPRLLQRARQQAAKILERAGVASRWEKCRTSLVEAEQDASCAQRAGAALIQLRIFPGNMAKKIASAETQFGYSLPLDGDFGIIAGVYLDRTLNFARLMGLDAEVVLGYTMAHEIGHLLLGSHSHASQGIMRPTWGERDIHLAKTGVLGFTASQARRMQLQVVQRVELDAR